MRGKNQAVALVSIIVIGYNSAKYIQETLDSCIKQTYKNIEIIISDDGSSDTTVRDCKRWIEERNSEINIIIVTSPINTGITKNCNRGLFHAKGDWVKFIAADDLLLPSGISDLMELVVDLNDNNLGVVFSKFLEFNDSGQAGELYPDAFTQRVILMNMPYWQGIALLFYFGNTAPGAFINRHILSDMGGFDENYFLLEDLPLWYKLTLKGYKFSLLNKTTVRYRVHENQATGNALSATLAADLKRFNKVTRAKSGFYGKVAFYHHALQIYADQSRMKRPKIVTRFIQALSPLKLLIYIINRISRR